MTCFRVNAPNVIHETIDGEAVIVNLQSGSYYSIDKVGASVWAHMEQGIAVDGIIAAIAGEYSGDPSAIAAGVRDLFTRLQEEGLVVPAETSSPAAAPADGTGQPKTPFERPVLHKYTDMEDLLLLDPIHDVGEKGWPNAPDKK